MIECFEYVLIGFNEKVAELPADVIAGTWSVREFAPIDVNEIDMPMPRSNSTRTETIEETFWNLGCEETHTLTLRSSAQYSDIRVGGDEMFIFSLSVIGKGITCEADPTHESTTASALYAGDIILGQVAAPYTYFLSETVDGVLRRSNLLQGAVTADVGLSYGLLSVSLSLPTVFSGWKYDVNTTVEYFQNPNAEGKYMRANATNVDTNLLLSNINDHITVACSVADESETPRNNIRHFANWEVTIENRGTYDYTDIEIPHSVYFDVYS